MADDSDVSVRFGADTGVLEAGAATASASVEDFGAQVSAITDAIQAQTAAMTAGFAEMAETITASMHEVEAAEEEAEAGMLGLLTTMREGVEQVTEMREAVMGFGEAMLAVFAFDEVKEFVERMGEAGEQVQHTAQAFGMTTGEVQQLQTVFTAAGAGPDALGSSMARLDRSASAAVSGQARAADAFKLIGVNLTESRTPAELMTATLEGFGNLDAGPTKVAAAMAIFGRNIQGIAPLIGMTAAQLEEYNAQADKYGAVNEQAVGRTAALGAALNENKNAMAGVGNVLGDALAPALIQIVDEINNMIAAFVHSYQSGGAVREVMDNIATAVSVLGSILGIVGDILADFFGPFVQSSQDANEKVGLLKGTLMLVGDTFVLLKAIVDTVFAFINAEVQNGIDSFKQFGQAVSDVAHLHFSQIGSDWAATNKAMEDRSAAAAEKIKGIWADARAAGAHMGQGSDKHEDSPGETSQVVQGLGGPKPKKAKDDLVSEWSEQLKQIDDLQTNWYADQNALAAQFWQGIVASGAGSAKDQQQAQDNLAEALKALDNEQVTSAVEAAKKKADAAKGNVDQVQAIYADLEATLIAHHAQGGQEWATVEQAKVEAVRKAVAEMRAERVKLIADQEKGAVSDDATAGRVGQLQLQGQAQAVQAQKTSGAINPQQELAQLAAIKQQEYELSVQTDDRIYQEHLAALQQLAAADGTTPAQLDEINAQTVTLTQQHNNQLLTLAQQNANQVAQAQQQAALQTQQHWASIISPITSGFASMTDGMLRGTETFGQGMMKIWDDLLNKFIEWEFEMLARHLAGEAGKTAGTTAGIAARTSAEQAGNAQSLLASLETTLKTVTNNAAAAASAAYSAMAGIPIVGPALGAAAAATTFVAVEAFGALASASGGYDIGNENPLVQAHAKEMVLPANLSEGFRNIIANQNGQAASPGGGGSRGGDTHNWNIQALDSRSMRRLADTSAGRSTIQHVSGKMAR